MSVSILANEREGIAALYCDTTDTAFGPIIRDAVDRIADLPDEREDAALEILSDLGIYDAETTARAFLVSLDEDARTLPPNDLDARYNAWVRDLDARMGGE